MPAARFDITLEEKANLAYIFTYRDSDGNPVDVTNYGGTIVLADGRGNTIYKGDDRDGVVQIGTTDGVIGIDVPFEEFDNLSTLVGTWQLYIYPTSGDPTDRPKRLLEGDFTYSRSLL